MHRPQLRRQARRTSALTPHCALVAALHRLAGNSSDPSQSVAPSSKHGGEGGELTSGGAGDRGGGCGGSEGGGGGDGRGGDRGEGEGGEGEGVGLQVNSLQLPLSFALNLYAVHHDFALPFSQANRQSDSLAARGGS